MKRSTRTEYAAVQLDVLQLKCDGLTLKEIASVLKIHVKSAQYHWEVLRHKFGSSKARQGRGTQSRGEAIVCRNAMRLGLVV